MPQFYLGGPMTGSPVHYHYPAFNQVSVLPENCQFLPAEITIGSTPVSDNLSSEFHMKSLSYCFGCCSATICRVSILLSHVFHVALAGIRQEAVVHMAPPLRLLLLSGV